MNPGLGAYQMSFHGWSGKGVCGQAYALRWSGRRCAPTALRCSVSWPCRRTRFVRCAHCTQTAATSQITTRAAREATSPGLAGRAGPGGPAVRQAQTVLRTVCVRAHLLGAPEARSSLPARAFSAESLLVRRKAALVPERWAAPGGGDFCGDEERRFEVGARSALRQLTCRSCLSAVSAANVASSAARPRTEHRSAVDAQHRPPQHEPPPGAARRDARTSPRRTPPEQIR